MSLAEAEVWTNKADFYMAALSYAVGFSTLWRFPFLCYKNGGNVFFIPYLVFSVVLGFPLVTFELTLGQYGRRGPVGVWNLCPLFRGIGWAMLAVNFVTNTYYVMLIGYGIYYVAMSFNFTLPWSDCANAWNTQHCVDASTLCVCDGKVWINDSCVDGPSNLRTTPYPGYRRCYPGLGTVPASKEYFYNEVLQISRGIQDLGIVRWPLLVCLLGAWCLILIILSLGVKTWGKFSYLTSILPLLGLSGYLMCILLQPGANTGIHHFTRPAWDRLFHYEIWADAATQVFLSLGVGVGSYVTMGRYNRFHSNPIIASGIIVLANVGGSIFCAFLVFTTMGFLTHTTRTTFQDLMTSGPDLAFVVFPQVLAGLPLSNIWSVIFFLSFSGLGLGSAVPGVANILVTFIEIAPALKSRLYRFLVLLLIATVSFAFGAFYTSNGGMYVLVLVDTFGPGYAMYILAFLQVFIISWVYASPRLLRDLSLMTGWWRCFCYMGFWNIICPLGILFVLADSAREWRPLTMDQYVFPTTATALGWVLTIAELAIAPVHLIIVLVVARVSGKLRQIVKPTKQWGKEVNCLADNAVILPTTEQSKM